MRITQIQLQNIGAFENETIIFKEKIAPEKAEIHIFVGENGTGKSTLLYALSAWNTQSELIYKRFRNNQANVIMSFSKDFSLQINYRGVIPLGDEREIRALWENSNKHYRFHLFSFTGFAYSSFRTLKSYPVNIQGDIQENPFENALDFEKSINPDLLNRWIANMLAKFTLAKSTEKAQKYREVITKLENIIATIIEKDFYFELDADNLDIKAVVNNQSLVLDVLPDGLKSMISWIGDLLMRLDRIPWENDTPILERNFILFLDEIEIHLHPAWQRKILPVIQDLFPNAQIFLATHSPFVANSVDGAYIYELENRNGNTKIAEIVISKTAQSIDSVLDKIFGVNEKYGESTQDELDVFYQTRDKILAKEVVNEEDFLQKARHLALKNAQIQTKIQFELKQLQRITGKEVWKI